MEASIVYTNTQQASSARKNLTPAAGVRESKILYIRRRGALEQRVLVGTALYLVFCLFMLYSAA